MAMRFAAEAHREQRMLGPEGFPYTVHLAMVAMELTAALAAERVESPDLALQCALLHDVLEDTRVTPGELTARFGAQVAAGVQALTRDAALPKDEQMADSLRRIRAQPREVWMVKLADRITNLQRPPGSWTRDHKRRYQEEATAILSALGEASPLLAARLREKIDAYAAFL